MVKHVVMFRMKDFADNHSKEENIYILKTALEKLPSLIKGINFSVSIGINYQNLPNACDFVLISDFKSDDDLKAYKVHPAHMKVKDLINLIVDSASVVDYLY